MQEERAAAQLLDDRMHLFRIDTGQALLQKLHRFVSRQRTHRKAFARERGRAQQRRHEYVPGPRRRKKLLQHIQSFHAV